MEQKKKRKRRSSRTIAPVRKRERPRTKPPSFFYATEEDMAVEIDKYFEDCPDTRTFFYPTKIGLVEKTIKYPTLCGLTYFLGFASRQSIYDYLRKQNWDCLKKAILRIENEYEKRLADKSAYGATFALTNMGWKNQLSVDQTIKQRISFEDMDETALDERIAELEKKK